MAWSQERKDKFQAAKALKNSAEKSAETRQRVRVPVAGRRDITAVHGIDTDQYVGRWVNDKDSRIEMTKAAGYEHVQSAKVGDSHVDGTHNEDGVVSRDMGKGVTAYLMQQKREYFDEDQASKQAIVDETEESIRRKPNENRNDGQYGEIKIG